MNPNEKRSNPSESHRSQYKRNSLSRTSDDARQKRLTLEQQLRKKHREQLITTKRFRTFDAATISGDEGEPEYDLSQQEVEKLCKDLKNVDYEVRVQTLKQLAEYLIDPPDTLKDFVMKGDCVEIFLQFLSGTDPEEQLHTTWCITSEHLL
ncbi:hypothetical protein BC937DRAFT_87911 [Endogone sp. FLAS-F59071]|nr:hypothetical protein BC937DRAFT_87911 [Endogone sp. FLAS-F59071]|eukprot:RUS23322.1 hypothetical protein BC937DRAFT_87911 [Endogone sp. FLAS-F59071]